MLLITTAVVAVSLAQANTQPDPIEELDFRDKLMLLTDGRNHYVALDPETPYGTTTFVGDGKSFYRVAMMGGSKMGSESWSGNFWEPRMERVNTGPASIEMRGSNKVFTVQCGKKKGEVKPVPADEAKKLLADAKFFERLWTRRPERLLRDDTGTYYLVDRYRSKDDGDRRDFRVFAGPKGAMKQLPLKDVVDDVKGLILATKDGNLRLVANADAAKDGESKWVKGKTSVPLVEVPLDSYDTARLIYNDLGPYAGQRLGTPCDDFM